MTPEQRAALNTADAAIVALAEAHRVLRASLADPAPAPVPVPAPPAPVPPPPLVEPPVGSAPQILREPINKKAVAWPTAWCWSANYQRGTTPITWLPGQKVTLEYQRGSLDGTPAVRVAGTYTLCVDGEPVATAELAASTAKWAFVFTAPAAPGWHTLTVKVPEGESQITYFAEVSGDADWSLIPAVQSSLELSHRGPEDSYHAWAWVPSQGRVARPTPDRFYQPVTSDTDQTADLLVPGDAEPPTTPAQRADGSWQTMGQQAYFWDQIGLRTAPDVHLLDGPRGIGTVCFATHIEVGRATQTEDPASTPRRNLYVCDPWRLMRVSNTGEITTLAGLRHKTGATDVPAELVGDWSAIPEGRRGFQLLWGMCWDSRTLTVDASQPPIEGRPPHGGNPRAYLADSRNNRVCRVEFDGRTHAPGKVSEVFKGLGVWDCLEDPHTNTMLVGLRNQHKVVRVTFDGEFIEPIIEHDSELHTPVTVDKRHLAWLDKGFTLEQAQAQAILAPEGMFLLDGLLYIGSRVQRRVTVVDLATKQVVRIVPITITGNSMFVKLAVSDGSYGPRGTIFFCTFDISHGARWYGIKPDGGRWSSSSATFYPYTIGSYQMAVGVGGGRMVVGGSDYGLVRFFKGPKVDVAKYRVGEKEFHRMHGRIVYGAQGVGRFDVPNPSDALGYYLSVNRGI